MYGRFPKDAVDELGIEPGGCAHVRIYDDGRVEMVGIEDSTAAAGAD